jgi:hypothetical protein
MYNKTKRDGASYLPLEDKPFELDEHGPVFILGCPRSGTTFLSHCIGALDGYREFVGVLVPPRLMHLVASTGSLQTQEHLMLCIRDIFWQAFWRSEYFRKQKLVHFLDGKVHWANLFSPPTLSGLTFCYKEPYLCFAAMKFAEHFPSARFIHIIRDGRDNADSMCRSYGDALSDEVLASEVLSLSKVSEIGFFKAHSGFNYPYWLAEHDWLNFRQMTKYGRYIMLWREMTERAMLLSGLPSHRYLEVRYESVVKDPIAEGLRIRDFLGACSGSSYSKVLKTAFLSSVGISKKNQSQQKLGEAAKVAGPLLSSLGYN